MRITDEVWAQLEPVVTRVRSRRGCKPVLPIREFVEAIVYLGRTGMPWRDLPECFGNWDAVYQRFRRWQTTGVWEKMFDELAGPEYDSVRMIFIDSTVVRAHQHAAGAPKKAAAKRPKRSAAPAAV